MTKGTIRLRRIDVLRGVAILSVFLLHWYGAAFGTDHLRWNGLVRDFASAPNTAFWCFYPLSYGWMGVSLFFVISGFCIHVSTLQTGNLHAGKFLWRRFWRICPPYFAWLAFFFWRDGLSLATGEGRTQLLSHLLLIYNFNSTTIFAISAAFWSLAVEAQLYLLYPLLWRIRSRWTMSGALYVTLGLSLLSRLVAALFLTDWREDLAGNVWTFPTMLWFDWTLGAVVAEGFLSGRRVFSRSVVLRVTAFVAVAVSLLFKPTEALTFSLSSFAIALQVESYLWSESRERVIERLLVPLGLCSYSFYLLHYPFVGELLQEIPLARGWQEPWHSVAVLPVMFSVLFLASYVSYRVLERGSIYLGRVIWPSLGKSGLGSHAAP